jgi:hypothetical protein
MVEKIFGVLFFKKEKIKIMFWSGYSQLFLSNFFK